MFPERSGTELGCPAIINSMEYRSVRATRSVLVVFVALMLAPFLWAASQSWFWQGRHSMAPVATAVFAALVAALVVGRYRWAWIVLALIYGAVLVSWAFDSRRFVSTHVVGLVLNVGAFVLLVSPPVRNHVRPPVVVPKSR
jgi:hypothetical protein